MEQAGSKSSARVAGIPTSFIANIGSGKPVLAILAEYDALPGLSQQAVAERQTPPRATAGHACGHHLFGVASATALPGKGQRRSKAGTIKGTLAVLRLPR